MALTVSCRSICPSRDIPVECKRTYSRHSTMAAPRASDLTRCHLGLFWQAGFCLISTLVSHTGLAMARKTQLARMIHRIRRLNQGFSTVLIASLLMGLVREKTQKEKSLACACTARFESAGQLIVLYSCRAQKTYSRICAVLQTAKHGIKTYAVSH